MRSIFRIPSDDMAGDAKRRVPIHYYTRRNRMDLLILIIIIIIAVSHNRELDIPGRLKRFFEKAGIVLLKGDAPARQHGESID